MTIRKFKERRKLIVPTFYVKPTDPRCKSAPQEKGAGAHGRLKSSTMQRMLLRRTGGFRVKIPEAEDQIRQNSPRLH